jgi:hypothetical protein
VIWIGLAVADQLADQPKRGCVNCWLAATVACGTSILLTSTIGRPVITWDEGFSIRREERMRNWFRLMVSPPQPGMRGRLLDESVIHDLWQFAREEPDGHPPFYAVIGNLGWLAGHAWLPPIQAHRLGPIALYSFTLGALFLFLARRWGRLVAATAAGAWLLMPRVFAHAHLASYDMPLACLWVLTVIAFWKARESSERKNGRGLAWSVVFATTLALGAATKFTGWLVPLPLAVWSIAAGLSKLKRDGARALVRLVPLALFCTFWLTTLPKIVQLIRVADHVVRASAGNARFRDDQARFQHAANVVRANESGWLPLAATLLPPAAWLAAAAAGRITRRTNLLGVGPVATCWTTAAALAPTLTILFVPNWWHDPLRGIAIFLWSNLTRQQTTWIPTQFFGTLYEFSLPWYNTLAWVALTVPPLTVLLVVCGLFALLRRTPGNAQYSIRSTQYSVRDAQDTSIRNAGSPCVTHQQSSGSDLSLPVLLILNAATLLVIRALPGAPGHDAERQLLGSFPFLACLAGFGAEALRSWLVRRTGATAATWTAWGIVALSLAWSAAATWHYRAAPLSYYTEVIGGLRGAVKLGLEPAYYWDALGDDAIAWLNEHTGPTETVRFCNYFDTLMYLQSPEQPGGLRVEIRPDRPGTKRWYVLQNRPGLFAETPWNRWLAEHGRPACTHELDGVPLIWIFPFDEYEKAIERAR